MLTPFFLASITFLCVQAPHSSPLMIFLFQLKAQSKIQKNRPSLPETMPTMIVYVTHKYFSKSVSIREGASDFLWKTSWGKHTSSVFHKQPKVDISRPKNQKRRTTWVAANPLGFPVIPKRGLIDSKKVPSWNILYLSAKVFKSKNLLAVLEEIGFGA